MEKIMGRGHGLHQSYEWVDYFKKIENCPSKGASTWSNSVRWTNTVTN